jgi:hypothetical protein
MFAGLLILALASCANPFRPEISSGKNTPEANAPKGKGLARINLNRTAARTALPDIGVYYFTLDFTAEGKPAIHETLDGGLSLAVALEPGVWTLEVKGYADSGKAALKVSGRSSVPIAAGTETSFEVYLTPDFSEAGTGDLSYSISFPASVRGFLGLYPIDDTPGKSQEIDISAGAGGTAAGILAGLAEGSYRAVIDLYDSANNKAAARTEVALIYGGLLTTLDRTFTPASFAGCPPVVGSGLTTLGAKLDAALASPSGTYTVTLDGTETDLASFSPKTLNVTGNKNITVLLRGNGKTVQLGSAGSLFILGAASGSSLNLELYDLTLRGRVNTTSLVQINERGTLIMKGGSLITGNTIDIDFGSAFGCGLYINSGTFSMSGGTVSGNSGYYYTSPSNVTNGGGVYIAGSGSFTMSGGTVSGNSARSGNFARGGGVFVGNGTFTMSGGAVSGNSASGSTADTYGGGVYIASNGTFTLSGGAVNDNYTQSNNYSSYGGGVYADGGNFYMSGGVVSDNSSSSSSSSSSSDSSGGGGVVILNGTFTMSGGLVNGNSSSSGRSSYGGGVYIEDSAFTLSGGAVSGNTATSSYSYNSNTSYGGGVFIYGDSSTFTMSGGMVSGNSASFGGGVYTRGSNAASTINGGAISGNSATASGGGVYVDDSIFIMSDGAVNGNTADTNGGGMYVNGGTFTMNGGAVNGNSTSSSSNAGSVHASGGGVYISSGTFGMSGGTVSGNIVSASFSSPSYAGSSYAYGGGVYVGSGAFAMSGGAVSDNSAAAFSSSARQYSYPSVGGGGIYVGGTFTMSGGTVSGNSATSATSDTFIYFGYYYGGGGVYVTGTGTFTMNGGAVSNNSTAGPGVHGGGGVCIRGIFSMNDGIVSDNEAPYGGGVSIESGTFTMTGGAVSGNSARSYGGGVNVEGSNATFAMSGGTVSGNKLTNGFGKEVVLIKGTFIMSGDARPERVFLYDNTMSITISGPLSGPGTPIVIDLGISSREPLTSWVNHEILKLDNSYSSGNLASLKNYFALGNSKMTDVDSPYAEAPITGYMISDGGLFVSDGSPPPSPPTLPSYNISNIAYSSVTGDPWTLESDGRYKSPFIINDGITKERISFTSTSAWANITIQLDISPTSYYTCAFISRLDDASATYDGAYFDGSRITDGSTTVIIPIPTAGSHFVDICYLNYSNGSNCAWFKVIE